MSEGPEVKHTVDKISEAILRKTIDNVYCKTSINAEFRKKIIGLKLIMVYSGVTLNANKMPPIVKVIGLC
ncbi:MAG: hypothetical protein WCF06_15055 [Nitrososphaeraceae archaeon]